MSDLPARLTELETALAGAATIAEARAVELAASREAAVIPQLVGDIRFLLRWQNQFAKLRFRAMWQVAELLESLPKNPGGDPAKVKDGPATYADMGISYKFASECRRIRKLPRDMFENWLALGETADDEAERDPWATRPFHKAYQPVELTKKDLLDLADTYINGQRSKEFREAERQQTTEETIRRAESQPEPEPEPPPPPAPPPPRPKPPANSLVKKMLRTAVDPAAGEGERAAALAAVQRTDPRLESLDDTRADLNHRVDRINDQQYRKLHDQHEKLRAENEKLRKRDRQQMETIRQLRAELEKLQRLVDNVNYLQERISQP